MPKRKHRSKPPTNSGAPTLSPENQEAVDGILVHITKRELTIAGEQPGSIRKLPGYAVSVAMPDWNKNRDPLRSVKKGYGAQQKLLARLGNEGADRSWMTQRFVEIDKAVAASLRTVAERIHTRRWREEERGDALNQLQDAFRDLERWTAKTARYCHRVADCTDALEKETLLDAACLGLLKVGELINKVERMQHGFWEAFCAAHFLEVRRIRNLIAHNGSVEGEAVVRLGTGIVQELNTAVRRTLFPQAAGPTEGGFMIPTKLLHELEPSCPGDKAEPSNSIAMIRTDDHNRFVINRVGRTEENRALISSSATGPMKLSICAVRPGAPTGPARPDGQA